MSFISFMIGGLIPTFIVSRLTLWLTKTLRGDGVTDVAYFALAHVIALLISAMLYGFGSGAGGLDNRLHNMVGQGLINGLLGYFVPQTIWLLLDLWRAERKRKKAVVGAE